METEKLNQGDKHKTCANIFEVFSKAEGYPENGTSQANYDWYEALARKVLEQHPEISVDAIEGSDDILFLLSFLSGHKEVLPVEKLHFDETIDRNAWMMSSLLVVMKNVLSNHKPVIIHYEKPSRMVSPPLEAYYQRGHNALNVGLHRIPDDIMAQMPRPYI